MDFAWTIIANAGGGDWSKEHPDWVKAAEKWRDEMWHPLIHPPMISAAGDAGVKSTSTPAESKDTPAAVAFPPELANHVGPIAPPRCTLCYVTADRMLAERDKNELS